jgi:hypothetical protein
MAGNLTDGCVCRYDGSGLVCPAVALRHSNYCRWARNPNKWAELDRLAVRLTEARYGSVPDSAAVRLAVAVRDCPDRGPTANPGGCRQVRECRAGVGVERGGRTFVTSADCYRCRAAVANESADR